MSKKNWDPNLTPEQNYILKQEGTEPPGSSILNNEKEKEVIIVWVAEQNFLSLILNMKVVQAGLHFSNLSLMSSKKKKICTLAMKEQNIIVKNVADIMVIFLRMVRNLQENDIATMECV